MKFKNIFLYIGMDKTGSSRLQSCFEQLELSGTFENMTYPATIADGDFRTIRGGNAMSFSMAAPKRSAKRV